MIRNHTLVRFLLVGVSNTLIGMGVIYFCWRVLGWPDLPANITGYAIGIVWSYTLNRLWTFQHRGAVVRSLPRFLLVCAIAYAANLAVLFAMRSLMGPESFLPHVVGMGVYTVTGYLGSRYFAFGSGRPLKSPAYTGEGIPPP
jgi:putative flippase GtrA